MRLHSSKTYGTGAFQHMSQKKACTSRTRASTLSIDLQTIKHSLQSLITLKTGLLLNVATLSLRKGKMFRYAFQMILIGPAFTVSSVAHVMKIKLF